MKQDTVKIGEPREEIDLIGSYRNRDYDEQFLPVSQIKSVAKNYRNSDYDEQFEPREKLFVDKSIVYSGE